MILLTQLVRQLVTYSGRNLSSIILSVLLVSFAVSEANSQSRPAREQPEKKGRLTDADNVAYVELLGNGFIYSLNYERMIDAHLSVRAGISYPYAGTMMLNGLIGPGSSKLELGVGAIGYLFDDNRIGPTVTAGYRYQPRDGGFVFRIGLTPTTIPNFFGSGSSFLPWAGISFGGAF